MNFGAVLADSYPGDLATGKVSCCLAEHAAMKPGYTCCCQYGIGDDLREIGLFAHWTRVPEISWESSSPSSR